MKSSQALLSVIVTVALMMPIVPQRALADDEGDAVSADEQADTSTDASGDTEGDTGSSDGTDTGDAGETGDAEDSGDSGETSETGEAADDPTEDSTADPAESPSPSPSPTPDSPEPSSSADEDSAPSSSPDGVEEEGEEEGDRTADVESAADWQAMADELDFTGQWAHDLLLMAESQLGYNESERNFIYDDDEGEKQGYTRYGDWYGDGDGALYGEWCAMFVSFCLHYAGVQNSYYDANCASWVARIQAADAEDEAAAEQAGEEFAAADHRYQSAEDYVPQAGDIVFFDKGTGTACHVGIVKCLNYDSEHGVQPTGFTTIEGNNGPVGYHSYALGDGGVLGFMRLPENPDYRTVQCGETPLCVTAEIPQDVTFTARTVAFAEVTEESEASEASEASGTSDASEAGSSGNATTDSSIGVIASAASEATDSETTVVADDNGVARTLTVPTGWELISLVEVDSTAGDEEWNPSKPAIGSFVRTGTLRARAAAVVAEDGTMEILERENVSSTVSFEYRGAGSYALLARKNTSIAEQVRMANEVKSALIVDDENSLENLAAHTVRATRARALSVNERIEASKVPSRIPKTEYQRELYKNQVIK